MPDIVTPTTKLEAVNEMLASIGQAPVNTLEVSGIADVAIAEMRLDQMTRKVLIHGFLFNVDRDYELSPDVNGFIIAPTNALKMEPMSPVEEIVVRRNPANDTLCLYSITEQTFEFAEPVALKIHWGFPFEDLPEVARSYITVAAARRFQSKFIGSQILDKFEEEDETKAWVALERADRGQSKTNLFRTNAGVASRINNRSY